MRAIDIIANKRDGEVLTAEEISAFVAAATKGSWPAYQLSALLMAIFCRGMSNDETAELTAAMVRSGVRLDLSDIPGSKVDKHSTGGVGDKTSLILAPLAAACGVVVPMMSGRGLGHTGGTLDKLESIPGFRIGLDEEEFRTALRSVGCALIGQTDRIAPADKTLYALRDATATVESIPLIAASIMSKKIAEGVDGLVLDVKCGSGAFMKTLDDARVLAQTLVAIGNANGVRTRAILTSMNDPLGRKIGNALEVMEAMETLRGEGPTDLEKLSVELAARMVHLAGIAPVMLEARARVREAIDNGQGLEKFRQIIAQQGGNPRVVDEPELLELAPGRAELKARRAGFIRGIDAEFAGRAAVLLGAGRDKVEDTVDPGVGIHLLIRRGEVVMAGQPLAVLYYRDETRLRGALALMEQACRIDDIPPPAQELILETLG